ncbi:hypothetical protein KFU94_01680 [Chloroflexi bacterium TSY]|nr:hypothetical protein [Chloroflexi bacterium TSY]
MDDDDVDPDHDGLTNIQEFFAGTNPDHPDTDRGGETDGSEVAKGRNPLDPSDDKIPPVVDFWVDNNDASVTLHYNPRSEVDGVRLWRSSDGITYNAIAIFPATSGVITDTGLTNGEAYLYKLQALARPGIVGVPSPPLLALPDVDTDAPESTVFINSGAYSTTSEIVTLTFLDPLLPDGTSDITHAGAQSAQFGRGPVATVYAVDELATATRSRDGYCLCLCALP